MTRVGLPRTGGNFVVARYFSFVTLHRGDYTPVTWYVNVVGTVVVRLFSSRVNLLDGLNVRLLI